MSPSVVVIGAGIAGLTAAYRLSCAGVAVTVIEASYHAGGRMSMAVREGYRIDRGAQFLSTGYEIIPELLRDVDLFDSLKTCSPWSGIVRNGKIRRVHSRGPATLASSGLLKWCDLLRLGWHSGLDARRSKALPLNDYSAWHEWDDVEAAGWLKKRYGHEVVEYLLEPMLQGFYFQAPEGNSRALPAWMNSFGARHCQTIALDQGMGSLTGALAAKLDVRLNTPALSVHHKADRAIIETSRGLLEADRVIIATTAPVARQLCPPETPLLQTLLDTRYSSTINLGIAFRDGLGETRIPDDVYGVLIPRNERKQIAAIGIESRKSRSLVPQGELLNVMLDGEAGKRLVNASEDAVLSEVLPELERYVPAAHQYMSFVHLNRWPQAEPLSPVGRSRAIAAYRASCTSMQRVVLAGDYLSVPTTEGAAHSGIWAADFLLDALNVRSR
ncbi:NAD(P)/FAD-dependent oxidoreductase [Paraburkholderia sp.]|uniref:protoporphyrinogen/coproporphyrinogen oxidase n=1 Tax=Paraburkholderia sp. TaxID=1926495 RepID=UPI0025F418CC|nr:FAD-dependent oxidoreductase [Paraburkholderia sp.]